MDEKMIAPCGMNCSLCISYQFGEHDLNKRGFHRKYCSGCIPRGKNCAYMKDSCKLLSEGSVRFCFECENFPCKRLKTLDKRYSTKYHMSMIDNLNNIKELGMDVFMKNECEKWRCKKCGATMCCHNGLCLNCNFNQLLRNPDIQPNGDVISEALGDANNTFIKFSDELSSRDIQLVWHYYTDGKAWLAKGLYKRTGIRGGQKETTVFWMSIWNGFFKITVYIPEKFRENVMNLPLKDKTKSMIMDSRQMGNRLKFFPLVFDLFSDEMFDDIYILIDFKKGI